MVEIGNGAVDCNTAAECCACIAGSVHKLILACIQKQEWRAVISEKYKVRVTISIEVGEKDIAKPAANLAQAGRSRRVSKRAVAVVVIKVNSAACKIVGEAKQVFMRRQAGIGVRGDYKVEQ